ncbi:TonB-dependent receptor [Aquimarina agarilytica]|uniref:TonB-dependent receptor n=1 Tax=Aquimarina agarilytica TaxID=1087449 RepID=UPI000287CF44|nr:TonB-dependent receptor [Aquimarina agarilytica]
MFRHYSSSKFVFTWIIFCFTSLLISAQTTVEVSGFKGKVLDQYGALPGAKVYIKETGAKTETDLEGAFFLEHIPGTFTLKVDYLLYEPFEEIVDLKTNEVLEFTIKLVPDWDEERPILLGSRSKPKTSLERIAPVDVIYPKDISNSSQMELGQLLHFLLPSFHSTHQTISDGTDHIDPATLRGLGPDQLLVLINGKRRHSSSLVNVNGTIGRGSVGTDFNAIPVASIERIEVLRDGASSQYGSDAIAGVVNIILKNQIEKIIIESVAKINHIGDGKSTYTSGNVGFNLGDKGFVNVSAEYRDRESTNRSGDYTGQVFGADENEDQLVDFFKQTGFSGRKVMEVGNAATRNIALQFNSEFKIGTKSTIYAFGGRNYREGRSRAFYRFPNEKNKVVTELFNNGFSPEIFTDIQDDAITIGIKGKKEAWNVDFSHTIGKNILDYTVNNSNNASLGEVSPKTFYAGGFIYSQNVTNLDFSKPLYFLEGSNIAFGAELRVENYQIVAGEEASFINGGDTFIENGTVFSRDVGAQGFPGFMPENELNKFRTNTSGYIEFESKVSDKILAVLGGRYETFNKFGSQGTWKVATRYQPTTNLTFRGSLSTGFRAPSLHQFYFNNTSTQFSNGAAFNVGTFNNSSAAAESLGIGVLQPELSKHYNFGLTTKLFNSFSLFIDSYVIRIEDRIVLSNPIDEGFEELLEPFNLDRAQFFTNAIDTRTIGLDIKLNYNTYLGSGKLFSTLSGNFSSTNILDEPRTSDQIAIQDQEIFNREERSRIESSQPTFKINFLNTYEIEQFSFTLNNNLFGSVTYRHPKDGDPNNWTLNEFTGNIESRDQKFSPKLVTDIALTYNFNNLVHLSIGANNAFHVFPDEHKHSGNVNQGRFIYSRRVQQFGVRGANYFARLLLKL